MDTHQMLPESSLSLRRFLVATHNLNVPWFTIPGGELQIMYTITMYLALTRVNHLVLLRVHSPSSLSQSKLIGKSHTESCKVARASYFAT